MFHSYLVPTLLTFSLTYSWYTIYGSRYFEKFEIFNGREKAKTKPALDVPVYMWEIFNNGINSSEVDVIKGVYPRYLSTSFESRSYVNHRLREIRFNIPESQKDEVLVKAEVRIATHEIRNPTHFQLYLKSDKWIFLDEKKISDNTTKWISLQVLPGNKTLGSGFVTILILTLFRNFNEYVCQDFLHPILFLSYYTKGEIHRRGKRDAGLEEYEEKTNKIWKNVLPQTTSNLPKKLKNSCRRKPLYIKFSDIDYDSWIVAPSGYEAFQCVGKCTFPVSEHLSPTKHAILQTLLHHVFPSKVSRACCVPTKLDPISILYIDANGVLTYRLRYRDMVVAECGCR